MVEGGRLYSDEPSEGMSAFSRAKAVSTTCGAGDRREAERAGPCSPLQTLSLAPLWSANRARWRRHLIAGQPLLVPGCSEGGEREGERERKRDREEGEREHAGWER